MHIKKCISDNRFYNNNQLIYTIFILLFNFSNVFWILNISDYDKDHCSQNLLDRLIIDLTVFHGKIKFIFYKGYVHEFL